MKKRSFFTICALFIYQCIYASTTNSFDSTDAFPTISDQLVYSVTDSANRVWSSTEGFKIKSHASFNANSAALTIPSGHSVTLSPADGQAGVGSLNFDFYKPARDDWANIIIYYRKDGGQWFECAFAPISSRVTAHSPDNLSVVLNQSGQIDLKIEIEDMDGLPKEGVMIDNLEITNFTPPVPGTNTTLTYGFESGEGFSNGSFTQITLANNTFTAPSGEAEIMGTSPNTGLSALKITGGTAHAFTLDIQDLVAITELSFYAERWTQAGVFEFYVAASSDGTNWTNIFSDTADSDGSATSQVPIGRDELFTIPLQGDEGYTQFRFTLSSQSGVIIDDLSIQGNYDAPVATDMSVQTIAITAETPTISKFAPEQDLLALNINTNHSANALTLESIRFTIDYDSAQTPAFVQSLKMQSDYNSRYVRHLYDSAPIQPTMPGGTTALVSISLNQKLKEGSNPFFLTGVFTDALESGQAFTISNINVTISGQTTTPTFTDTTYTVADIPHRQTLAQPGQYGSKNYRIPGLATSNEGTLLAVYDIRYDHNGDIPAHVDVGLRRSTDNGLTWDKMQVIMDTDDEGTDLVSNTVGNGIGDPAILVDRADNTIYVAAVWSCGSRNAFRGTNGTGFGVDETAQFVLVKSTDDGVTWSAPINITSQVKDHDWHMVFQGPGKGICMQDGTLVFPAQFINPQRTPLSTIIYSKDQGETWQIGTGAKNNTTEAQVIELDDGSLMLSMRTNGVGYRSVAVTNDLGATWTEHSSSAGIGNLLRDPVCMASLDRYPDHSILLYTNPNSGSRNNMSIKVSTDQGVSWPYVRTLEAGGSAYSCLTVLDDHSLGCFYEIGESIVFERFSLEWATQNALATPSTTESLQIASALLPPPSNGTIDVANASLTAAKNGQSITDLSGYDFMAIHSEYFSADGSVATLRKPLANMDRAPLSFRLREQSSGLLSNIITQTVLFAPQTYQQSNGSHPITVVDQGEADAPLLKIGIEMANYADAYALTAMRLSLVGENELSTLKLYTSTTDDFASATLIITLDNPTSTPLVQLTTPSDLTGGTTYFWVTGDVKSEATVDGVIDISCTQISLNNGTETRQVIPTNAAPAGQVTIQAHDPLVMFYQFDETAGSIATDSSSSNYDATIGSSVNIGEEGLIGSAFAFSGPYTATGTLINNQLDITTDELTICLWVKTTQSQPSHAAFFFNRSHSATGFGINNDKLTYHWNDTASSYNFTSGPSLPHDGEWYFIAMSVSPTTANFYVHDGQSFQVGTNTTAHAPAILSGNNVIGADPNNSSRFFSGLMDNLRVYDRTLSQQELLAIYTSDLANRPAQSIQQIQISHPQSRIFPDNHSRLLLIDIETDLAQQPYQLEDLSLNLTGDWSQMQNLSIAQNVAGVETTIGTLSTNGTVTLTSSPQLHSGHNYFYITATPSSQINEPLTLDLGLNNVTLSREAVSETFTPTTIEAIGDLTVDPNLIPGVMTTPMESDSPWEVVASDAASSGYALKAGSITHNETSIAILTVEVTEDSVLSFGYQVSSESNYDYLTVSVNEVQLLYEAGEIAWTPVQTELPAGTHTIKLEYEKDGSVSRAEDTAWIKDLTIGPQIEYTVTFELGEHGQTTDELVQTVFHGGSVTAPTVNTPMEWIFTGWDLDFSQVTANLTIQALYEAAVDITSPVNFENSQILPDGFFVPYGVGEGWVVNANGQLEAPLTNNLRTIAFTTPAGFNSLYFDYHYFEASSQLSIYINDSYRGRLTPGDDWQTYISELNTSRRHRVVIQFDGASTDAENPPRIDNIRVYNRPEYTVTLDRSTPDATTPNTRTYTVLENDDLAHVTTRFSFPGWNFTGWDKPLTNITEDQTIRAQFEAVTPLAASTQFETNQIPEGFVTPWDQSISYALQPTAGINNSQALGITPTTSYESFQLHLDTDEPVLEFKFKWLNNSTGSLESYVNDQHIYVTHDGTDWSTVRFETPSTPTVLTFTISTNNFDSQSPDILLIDDLRCFTPIAYSVEFVASPQITIHDPNQMVYQNFDATAPSFTVAPGWLFSGWDQNFDNVQTTLTVRPILERQPLFNTQLVDFENNTLPVGFTHHPTNSQSPWVIVADTSNGGNYTYKSGTITHNENSEMIFQGYFDAGEFSFDYKTDSESGFDSLEFWVDERRLLQEDGSNDWTTFTTPIEAGFHRFRLVYEKDGSVDDGADAVWIDNILAPTILDKTFTVTFEAGPQGRIDGQNIFVIEPGLDVTAPFVTPKTGWLHDDWNHPLTVITEDQTITATYQLNNYTANLKEDLLAQNLTNLNDLNLLTYQNHIAQFETQGPLDHAFKQDVIHAINEEKVLIEIPLNPGWNMISSPFSDWCVRTAMIDRHFTYSLYNYSDQLYQIPTVTPGNQQVLEALQGYWVHVETNQIGRLPIFGFQENIQAPTLVNGWNNIGVEVNLTTAQYLETHPELNPTIWAWNAETQTYIEPEMLDIGQAYWVYRQAAE